MLISDNDMFFEMSIHRIGLNFKFELGNMSVVFERVKHVEFEIKFIFKGHISKGEDLS